MPTSKLMGGSIFMGKPLEVKCVSIKNLVCMTHEKWTQTVIGELNPSSVPAGNICPKYTNNHQRFYYLPHHDTSLKKAESLTSAKF